MVEEMRKYVELHPELRVQFGAIMVTNCSPEHAPALCLRHELYRRVAGTWRLDDLQKF